MPYWSILRETDENESTMALSFFMGGNPEDYFLIRDYANTILIADDDRAKTVIIMLNMFHSCNEYEREVPRLIDHYKKIDYNIAGIVYLMKGTKIGHAKSSKTFIYGSNVYQIDTVTIIYP
jgi:spermidine/putrescine-binding protein